MTKPKEDWRHAYIATSLQDMKKAQQSREGIRWAIAAGVAIGTLASVVTALLG